jgi:adenylate kinase family enzyme
MIKQVIKMRGIKKIVVVGVSASGKTTFSRKLTSKTGLPAIHVDGLMWKPGWKHVGDEEMVKLIAQASQQDEWIIEGYITKAARRDLFEKADQILYLDYPRLLPALRYIKRWWQHRKYPRPELPGSPEKFYLKFLLFICSKREAWELERLFRESNWDSKIVRLKGSKQTDRFLQDL